MSKFTKYAIGYGVISFIALLVFLGSSSGLLPIIVGSVLAIAPVPVYIWLILRTDPSPEPWKILVPCFIWGLAASAVLSLLFNTVAAGFVTATAGKVILAPLIEEFFKGLALIGLLLFAREYMNNLRDGMVYGSMVGLGFAMTENVLYYVQAFLSGGFVEAFKTFGLRALGGVYAHPVFTSLTALGLVLAMKQKNPTLQKLVGFGGFLIAVLMHMAWNASPLLGQKGFWLMWVVVYMPALLFLFNYKFKEKKL